MSSRPPRRFVAVATTTYPEEWNDLPGVADEVEVVRRWLCAEELDPARRFEHHLPHLADNPDDALLRREFRTLGRELQHRRAAAVFVTGHGEARDQGHVLIVHEDGGAGRQWVDLRTWELLDALRGPPGHGVTDDVLVIIDSCSAGALIQDASRADRQLPGGWVVLTSAAADEKAGTGALTRAIADFIGTLDPGRGRRFDTAILDVRDFVDGVRERLGAGQRLRTLHGTRDSGPHPCLPNPAFRPPDDRDVALEPAHRDFVVPLRDLRAHWDPRARGVLDAETPAWLFTGREEITRTLIARTTGPAGLLVVTGAAGTGKSAVLARLVALADRRFLDRHPEAAALPPDQRPRPGAVDAAVVATRRPHTRVLVDLLEAVGATLPTETHDGEPLLDAWQRWAARHDRPHVVVVDALEEAERPSVLADVLVGLVRRDPRLTLFVGVRSTRTVVDHQGGAGEQSVVGRLVDGVYDASVVRVDDDPERTRADIAAYVRSALEARRGSPYVGDRRRAAEVAERIADRVDGSFLVSVLQAHSLVRRSLPVEPDDAAWLDEIDGEVEGVFVRDLHEWHPDPDRRARTLDLLRAVAFGRGRGIPWLRVWPTIATALASSAGRTFGDDEISDLLDGPLGGYLVADREDGATVYRLVHERLRDLLREADPVRLLAGGGGRPGRDAP